MNKRIVAEFKGQARMLNMANFLGYLFESGIRDIRIEYDDCIPWEETITVSYENDNMAQEPEEAVELNKEFCKEKGIDAEIYAEDAED